jgi:hypothetical protein
VTILIIVVIIILVTTIITSIMIIITIIPTAEVISARISTATTRKALSLSRKEIALIVAVKVMEITTEREKVRK